MKALVVAVMAAALSLTVLAGPASAQITGLSGSGAYGEGVDVTLLGSAVTSGPTPQVTLPPEGGGPFTNSLASVSVPNLLTAGVLNVSTEGKNGTTTSSASVADVSLAPNGQPVLSAAAITSQCTADGGLSGSAGLVDATFGGQALPVNPPPNTTIDVPGVGSIILNEQIVTGSQITVNSAHVKLDLTEVATGDVILSQSRCEPLVQAGAATPVVAGPKFTG